MSKSRFTPISVCPEDAAYLMGISRARVYELKNAGELPFYKDGSKTLFPVADIEARIKRLSRISRQGLRRPVTERASAPGGKPPQHRVAGSANDRLAASHRRVRRPVLTYPGQAHFAVAGEARKCGDCTFWTPNGQKGATTAICAKARAIGAPKKIPSSPPPANISRQGEPKNDDRRRRS